MRKNIYFLSLQNFPTGLLLVPKDQADIDLMISEFHDRSNSQEFFIGLSDEAVDGELRWNDGTSKL